jgi:sugar phosphate isomerase/epimerase
VSTVCAYPGELLAGSNEERQEAVIAVKERLQICSDLGGVGVIAVPVFGQPKISATSKKQNVLEAEKKILVQEYKTLARHAENLGVCVLLEPINRYETHFINTIEMAMEIQEAVASEGLKIMADFFHMNIEEANISESLGKAAGLLAHLHLADSNRLLPGRGHTDFKSAFNLLKRIGYKNFMAIESNVPDNPNEELPKCMRYLRSCL